MANKLHAKCPVCRTDVRLHEQESLAIMKARGVVWFCSSDSVFELIDRISKTPATRNLDPHSERKIIHWACNLCLKEGRALKADVDRQEYFDCFPYFAYFDENLTCTSCYQNYTFTKEEQLHWYETLKFWVQSRPIKCKACYKEAKDRGNNPGPKALQEKDICAKLMSLKSLNPMPEQVLEVEAYLDSKHQGVRSKAAQVLADWKSHSSLPALLKADRRNKKCSSLRGVIAKAIAEVILPEDAESMVEWFLSKRTYGERYDFVPVMAKVDWDRALPLLEAAWAKTLQNHSQENRNLRHLILNFLPSNRASAFVAKALNDPDSEIRLLAQSRQSLNSKP